MFSKVTIAKIAVEQICQTNTWAKTDHLRKNSPITLLKKTLLQDFFQEFYFEKSQQTSYRTLFNELLFL